MPRFRKSSNKSINEMILLTRRTPVTADTAGREQDVSGIVRLEAHVNSVAKRRCCWTCSTHLNTKICCGTLPVRPVR